jgi:DNA invertase Pin-like site-specific DNA recombinase
MSTDHQKYSIENQRALIQTYAAAHGMSIMRTYMDAGKSGVTLRGRSGLSALLADVVSGTAPFSGILVYDISRWGRFQDADESAHYEFICRRAGISIVYCAEQFPADATPLNSVLKSLKRAMAGEFSRELGVKVSAGKARIGKLGYRIGGDPGFGLRRQLLGSGKDPGMVLEPGQRKSLQTDRVKLIPGPIEEIQLVHQIYMRYIYLRMSERQIADDLNQQGHTFRSRPWSRALVRTILSNEKYIGNNIVGRVSARLFTRQVTKPADTWTRCEAAFAAIVPIHLFEAAQRVRRFNEKVCLSRDDLLKAMRKVLKREGSLSAEIIRKAPELPSSQTIGARFGSLGLAYEALGYQPRPQYQHYAIERTLATRRTQLQQELLELLTTHGFSSWLSGSRFLTLGDLSNVEVMVCRWQKRHDHDAGWRINYQRSAWADFIVAARMNPDATSVRDYLLVPGSDLASLPIYLRRSHEKVLAKYRYASLDALTKKMIDSHRRQELGNGRKEAEAPRELGNAGRRTSTYRRCTASSSA